METSREPRPREADCPVTLGKPFPHPRALPALTLLTPGVSDGPAATLSAFPTWSVWGGRAAQPCVGTAMGQGCQGRMELGEGVLTRHYLMPRDASLGREGPPTKSTAPTPVWAGLGLHRLFHKQKARQPHLRQAGASPRQGPSFPSSSL